MQPATPRIARSFLTLGAGELVARLAAFGVSIYLSRTLAPAAFGIIGFSLAVMLYLQRVAGWELEPVGVYEVSDDDPVARRTIGSLVVFRAVVAVALIAATSLIAFALLPRRDAIVLSLYAASLLPLSANLRWVHLMRHNAVPPGVARVVAEGAAACVVLLLVHSTADIGLVPLGQLAADVTAAIILILALPTPRMDFDLRSAWRSARPAVVRAAPVLLYSLLGLVTFNMDLIILRTERGDADAGLYAAAYAVTGLIISLGAAFYSSVVPVFTQRRDDREGLQAIYRTSLVPVVTLALPAAVGGMLVAPQLIWTVFGVTYSPSILPLRPLLVAAALTAIRMIPLAVLVASGNRGRAVWMNVVAAIVNIALNLLLIPRYGMIGAASSTLVTDVIRIVMAFALVARSGFTPLRLAWIWRPVAACAVMGIAVSAVISQRIWISIPVGVFAFGGALIAFGGVSVSRSGVRLRAL